MRQTQLFHREQLILSTGTILQSIYPEDQRIGVLGMLVQSIQAPFLRL